MIDIDTKVDGVSTMPASEMNSIVSELESIVTSAGLTLSSGSVIQISEAIARYAAGGGQWYTDSGTADTYVLASVLSYNTQEAYTEGMVIGCVANVTSTAAGSTINVNSIGSVSLLDASGSALVANSIVAGTTFFARYDSSAGAFKFTIESGIANLFADPNPILSAALDTGGFSIKESEGAAVASTASPNIWAGDGNTLHITGTTTITDFTDAPRIGAWKKIIFDAALILTTGSGITIQGGENITTKAGEFAFIYADSVDAFRLIYHYPRATQAQMEAAADITSMVSPGRATFHPGVAKAWVKFNSVGTFSIGDSYNVSSLGDNGVGDFTVNFDTDFSSAQYAFAGICGSGAGSGTGVNLSVSSTTAPLAEACRMNITNDANAANADTDHVGVTFYGDQA